MRPFWSYYGSAWSKTRRGIYPAPDPALPVVEPFAGSAGYSVWHNHPRVMLYDLDENVVATWRYLISVSETELRGLPDVAHDQTVDDLNVCDEARVLIGWWLGRARHRPARKPGSWYINHCKPSNGWSPKIRHRLAGQLQLIRGWQVEHADYRDSYGGCATRFVDPPYEGKSGRRYVHGSTQIDFTDLGRWCRRSKGLTIVCESSRASWLPFWFVGEQTAGVGKCSEAVCILRDGWVDRPQGELPLELARGSEAFEAAR